MQSLRIQRFLVAVKHVHCRKVCITDTYDDDCEWVATATHNLINCLLNVVNYSISDYQKYLELLIAVATRIRLGHVVHGVQDAREVGRAVEIHDVHAVLVVVDDSLKTIDLWIENVTIHREAVVRTLVVWGHTSTEAKKIYLFVGVVVLQDTPDLIDHLKVLIARRVKIVQRFWRGGLPIAQREVDSDREVDVATAENVLEE